MKKYDQQRLFEVMGRLDKTFKPKQNLNEWNFDKKKGEKDKDEEKKETPEHEKSEIPAEEKAEHEEDKKDEVDETTTEPKSKIPVNAIAKVGGK